jgi:hypothetical protein
LGLRPHLCILNLLLHHHLHLLLLLAIRAGLSSSIGQIIEVATLWTLIHLAPGIGVPIELHYRDAGPGEVLHEPHILTVEVLFAPPKAEKGFGYPGGMDLNLSARSWEHGK